MRGAYESLGVLGYGVWADGVDPGGEVSPAVSADEDGSGDGCAGDAYGEMLAPSAPAYAYEPGYAW